MEPNTDRTPTTTSAPEPASELTPSAAASPAPDVPNPANAPAPDAPYTLDEPFDADQAQILGVAPVGAEPDTELTPEEEIRATHDEALRRDEVVTKILERYQRVNSIDPSEYERLEVKRGLRNDDGTGVVAGLTNISNVHGYVVSDGVKRPDEGSLRFRGYEISDLLSDPSPDYRFNFEEVAYLLMMGELPTQTERDDFVRVIDHYRELPDGFTASVIMHKPPRDPMNALARTILTLYSDDPRAEERSALHELFTAISLLSRLPRIMVLNYYAINAAYRHGPMILHRFIPGQSTAETILSMLRPTRDFTPEEARMLDIMLCLHAEHGGGNNSTFATRVLSSADTDPYSSYAAAIGSLKGNRHGGANHKVCAMHEEIKRNVAHWDDEGEVADYLTRIVRKEAFDRTGLIYGMGHAVYTLSDPRAVVLKRFAERLAAGTRFEAEFRLLETIERITPEIFAREKGSTKELCANVDMYSGFVYSMMGIPEELFTPLFACARMAGWAAHRIEEIETGRRLIRPAYRNATTETKPYLPIDARS